MDRTYISELDLYVRIKQEKGIKTYLRFYTLTNELVMSYAFNKIDLKTAGFGIGRYLSEILNTYEEIKNGYQEKPYFEMIGNYTLKGEK